ncbi:unnamed protein product [Cuscuta campestris]|uniref:Uncharacterized protein n=1 Tax=Cuscuta campestris TaxID=132261 RepID=A0A484N6M7_9ASTE|nr:unnamed protein product [Cuscuta campestris]
MKRRRGRLPSGNGNRPRYYKDEELNLTDLNFDVLKHIMYYVAVSDDGARNVAHAMSVCRLFNELGNDKDVLRAVIFNHDSALTSIDPSFWQTTGLLCNCLIHQNMSAFDTAKLYAEKLKSKFILLKVITICKLMVMGDRERDVAFLNTRARKRALDIAIDDYREYSSAIKTLMQNIKQFLRMLNFVLNGIGAQPTT